MSDSESPTVQAADVEPELFETVHRFRDVLSLRPDILRCFADQGVQVEGWLKGELLAFLTQEKVAGRIVDFDREVLTGFGKRKTDLTLDLQIGLIRCRVWLELKHYLIGLQKGIPYKAYDYFNDPSNGIKPDIEKLLEITSPHRYVLILMATNPGREDWQAGISRFSEKFHLRLRPLTDPEEFPEYFFLGLMAVEKSASQASAAS